MVAEVVLTFRDHMDKASMDEAVEAYHEAFSDAAGKMAMLEFELDEALLSAPRSRRNGLGRRDSVRTLSTSTRGKTDERLLQ
ncbi:hypothetical protein ACFWEH_10765 [Streptomyces anulatus]|uniref:hypothetical protein n=1 Tax=Streptomyces TaxID=1883 RepID=UPI0009399DE0|nr:hypothetical protein [Streptomyces sp. TSRI0395]OKI83420.1 hypothetical protein AMK12_09550 [Streptomyces sp. TSRI0395]